MKFFSLLAPLALVSTGLAFPGGWNNQNYGLSQGDAVDIVSKFTQILSHSDVAAANATAQALIGEGFVEKSDSINILAGIPVSFASIGEDLRQTTNKMTARLHNHQRQASLHQWCAQRSRTQRC